MNREKFLARKNPKATETVTLADGDTIKVRKLTQAEVEHMRRHYATPDKQLPGLRYIVCVCCLNDDDTQMFDPKTDIDALTDLGFDDINTIAMAVGKFSGTAGPNA